MSGSMETQAPQAIQLSALLSSGRKVHILLGAVFSINIIVSLYIPKYLGLLLF